MILDQGLHCTELGGTVIAAPWCIAEVLAERRTDLRKMPLVVSVGENTATLLALEVCAVEDFLHVGVQLSRLPRLVALTTLARPSRLAKGSLAALLAESFLALTAAYWLSDHVIADLALEERIEVVDCLVTMEHPVRILDQTWILNWPQFFDQPLQHLPVDMLCHGM